MYQVFVRHANLHGNSISLVAADVLSRDGETLTVKYRDTGKVGTVEAKQVIEGAKMYGGQPGVVSRRADRMVARQFPVHMDNRK